MFATATLNAPRSRPVLPQSLLGGAPDFAPDVLRRGAKPAAPGLACVLESLGANSASVRAERDEEIVAQADPAGYCYLVVSGCARTVKLMEDGRRQVGEFLLPGDLFGWEALEEHDFGLEAVSAAAFLRFPRAAFYALADRDRDFARRLRELTAGQLRAGRERMVLLGRKTASERIASFLLEMAERIRPEAGTMIELPMSRADMADYLGLTIETVCRGLTQLRTQRVIAVERSRIVILDRRALGVAGCEVVH
ncbi:MAG TPA: helix-turn-helix domain-containing protein [Acetobacteraceae bacterium]|jgi:CRP/FNR family transcriptional regulator, nitrogen fixation regulation protein|nr:helix-turn-helix domain-containing protein [Acetobacteraceae bacterium]